MKKNKLSEKKMVNLFTKKMKQENHLFKHIKEYYVPPLKIDYICFMDGDFIAIEFKLTNWKKVIMQANNNKYWFEKVFICMLEPKTEKKCNEIIDNAKKLDIGVIFYNEGLNEFIQSFSPKTKRDNHFTLMKLKTKSLKTTLGFKENYNYE